ncbi:TIGR01841 family phasin [Rhizobiaceae bacterium]|nr:TIGR01841 family phasin [Rhizobiaceae bacterium]
MSDDNKSGPIFAAFQRLGERMALPQVTISNVMGHHRRNIQAMQEAARNTSQGAQAVLAKQREALERTLGDVAETVRETKLTDPPMEQIAAQAEFARRAFDATVKTTTEMGSIVRDTSQANMAVLRDRVQESIEEVKGAIGRGETDDEPPVDAK